MRTIINTLLGTLALLLGVAAIPRSAYAAPKPNILFIAVDDLRPELGCYGSDLAITPNMDKLAASGLRFDRAYCQQAICAASRASLLTGTRPDTTGVIHNYLRLRDTSPNLVTLPQQFRTHGYETVYVGKIFHGNDTDEKLSWSRKPSQNTLTIPRPMGDYALPENQRLARENMQAMLKKYGQAARLGLGSGPAFECADVSDTAYLDGYNTELAIATMKELSKGDKPFFLGLGFHKPHLNWTAPKRYWDLYAPAKITPAKQTKGPRDGAAVGLHESFELRTRTGIPKLESIDDKLAVTLKHAYLACVSYVDALIGHALTELDNAGLRDNTIIILWSDHGWHLGEMGIWGKATNYELATRVPMIISAPGMKARGKSTRALVELIDIYPTLCELAALPCPKQIEGVSFVPLLEKPNLPGKEAALSQFPSPALREWAAYPLSPEMRQTFFGPLIENVEKRIIAQEGDKWDRNLFEKHLMGYSLRTDRYRYIEWRDYREKNAAPVFVELYDHQTDPSESVNVAKANPAVLKELSGQVRARLK